MQQAEFGRPQVNRLAVAVHAVGYRVQAQAVDVHRVVGHLRARRRSTALMRACSSRGETAW